VRGEGGDAGGHEIVVGGLFIEEGVEEPGGLGRAR